MISSANKHFPHRRNRDGSFDSICKRCFQTIASCSSETALSVAETKHTCDGPPLFIALRPQQNFLLSSTQV